MASVCIAVGAMQLIVAPVFLCCFTIASGRITDKLRRAYLHAVLHQDVEFFEHVGPGEIGVRMLKDINTIKAAVGEKLGFMCWAFTTLLVALIMAFSRAARLAGVVFGVVPLVFILFVGIGYLSVLADSRLLDVNGQAGTLLEQILGGVRVVQSFAAESFLAKKYDSYLSQVQGLAARRSVVRGLELGTIYCVLNLTYSVCFWYGSQQIAHNGLTVGLMFTVFWNMFNAVYAIATILPHISAIRDSVSTSARILGDIERAPTIDVSKPHGAKPWGTQTEKATPVEVEFQNVTFSYPSRPSYKSLDNVNFRLEAGKVTAIVGASGSGKSTIASLLLRYYDPTGPQNDVQPLGRILVAGHDLDNLNLAWIRSQIGYVAQEPQLFTASIFENVAFGLSGTPWELPTSPSDPNYPNLLVDAKILVEEALKQAQAWDFEISFFDQEANAAGALTAAISSCTNNVSVAIGLVWPQIIMTGADFLGGIILGLVLSWTLALPCLAPIPLLLAAAYYNIAYLEKYENDVQKPLEEASAFASEHVDAIKTVAALGRQERVMEQFDISASNTVARPRHLLIGAVGFGVGIGFVLVLSAIVMWWGVELYVTQRISLPHFFSTFEAVLLAGFSASRLFTFVPDLARMMQGFRRICSWEDRQPEVARLAF
ncbi:hypothetical protein FRC06_005779, partial [Ceratobasidium sp. 370]